MPSSRAARFLRLEKNRDEITRKDHDFKTRKLTFLSLSSKNDEEESKKESKVNKNEGGKKQQRSSKSKSSKKKNVANSSPIISKETKQKIVAKAAQELRQRTKKSTNSNNNNNNNNINNPLLDLVTNPFEAGKKLRTALESLTGLSEDTKSAYFLDDRISSLSERNPSVLSNYVPEVLVVGATGDVGRLVVRRLLLSGNVRVRVLVRDLYSRTLNLLGTGVTYCQGDLSNMESLEYALTDVDKIVFCANAAATTTIRQNHHNQKDDDNVDTIDSDLQEYYPKEVDTTESNIDGKQESIVQLRAKVAEQIDLIGMQNLIRAYQNVRFADYGASQTVKRALFKFGSKEQDFSLFSIEDDDDDEENDNGDQKATDSSYNDMDDDDQDYYDEWNDSYDTKEQEDNDDYNQATIRRRDGSVLTKTQCLWMKNTFGHAVFVGKVLYPTGEAAVISSRLRSREEPEMGIDLSQGFGGFILRVCSDGNPYEAFIRTELFDTMGMEYVYQFTTDSKIPRGKENKSRNKFTTIRLAFESFQPIVKKEMEHNTESSSSSSSPSADRNNSVPPFRGQDVRYIGFRFRSDACPTTTKPRMFAFKNQQKDNGVQYRQFYMALDYIKVFRSQPEPEFVYLSDARIPPVITAGMVRHDRKEIHDKEPPKEGDPLLVIDDDMDKPSIDSRIPEETYYKYRGEEILKSSGLAYTILRIAGWNDLTTGESSRIRLSSQPVGSSSSSSSSSFFSLEETVSRLDVAEVCAAALLDPHALNKSIYLSRNSGAVTAMDEDISMKFASISTDRAKVTTNPVSQGN